jgi:two-component system sensor histidine kinase KdpD
MNAIDDVVGVALQRVAPPGSNRSVLASVDTSDGVLLATFDFSATLRILANLLDNALKYSPPSTPVELCAQRRGAVVDISVADRGPGVAPAERERIFEPFYRGRGAAAQARGTGLGLAIARRLAEAQGGKLEVESRNGGGALFRLTLPAAEFAVIEAEPHRLSPV